MLENNFRNLNIGVIKSSVQCAELIFKRNPCQQVSSPPHPHPKIQKQKNNNSCTCILIDLPTGEILDPPWKMCTGLDLGGGGVVQGVRTTPCHFNLHYLFALVCKSVFGKTTNYNLLEVLSAYTCAPAAFSLLVKPTTSAIEVLCLLEPATLAIS